MSKTDKERDFTIDRYNELMEIVKEKEESGIEVERNFRDTFWEEEVSCSEIMSLDEYHALLIYVYEYDKTTITNIFEDVSTSDRNTAETISSLANICENLKKTLEVFKNAMNVTNITTEYGMQNALEAPLEEIKDEKYNMYKELFLADKYDENGKVVGKCCNTDYVEIYFRKDPEEVSFEEEMAFLGMLMEIDPNDKESLENILNASYTEVEGDVKFRSKTTCNPDDNGPIVANEYQTKIGMSPLAKRGFLNYYLLVYGYEQMSEEDKENSCLFEGKDENAMREEKTKAMMLYQVEYNVPYIDGLECGDLVPYSEEKNDVKIDPTKYKPIKLTGINDLNISNKEFNGYKVTFCDDLSEKKSLKKEEMYVFKDGTQIDNNKDNLVEHIGNKEIEVAYESQKVEESDDEFNKWILTNGVSIGMTMANVSAAPTIAYTIITAVSGGIPDDKEDAIEKNKKVEKNKKNAKNRYNKVTRSSYNYADECGVDGGITVYSTKDGYMKVVNPEFNEADFKWKAACYNVNNTDGWQIEEQDVKNVYMPERTTTAEERAESEKKIVGEKKNGNTVKEGYGEWVAQNGKGINNFDKQYERAADNSNLPKTNVKGQVYSPEIFTIKELEEIEKSANDVNYKMDEETRRSILEKTSN